MSKALAFLLLITFNIAYGDETELPSEKPPNNVGRQKRLLFYDEDGNLVKTFTNPYLRDFALHGDRMPLYGNFMNPFYAYIRASYGGSSSAFTIPVSSEIIDKIQSDPSFQLRLAVEPKKDTVIRTNPLCEGKRTQVPSPLHCNNFLNCWDGWSFEQECPPGLLFSREGYCDYSDNVDCKNREILIKPVHPAVSEEPKPQPALPLPQPTIPSYPQPQPSPQPQPPSQSAPPASQPQLPCLQQNTPTSQLSPSVSQSPQQQLILVEPPKIQLLPAQPSRLQTEPGYLSKCTEEFKTYRSTHNCKEFYMCVDGKLDKYVCTGDLVFSQIAGLCFLPGLVDCGTTPVIYSPALYKIESLNSNYMPAYIKSN